MRTALILISAMLLTALAWEIHMGLGILVGALALGGVNGLLPVPRKLTPDQQANADRRALGYRAPADKRKLTAAERKIDALRKKLGYD